MEDKPSSDETSSRRIAFPIRNPSLEKPHTCRWKFFSVGRNLGLYGSFVLVYSNRERGHGVRTRYGWMATVRNGIFNGVVNVVSLLLYMVCYGMR